MATRLSSRVPQTLANLFTLYRTCPGLDGVSIDYGLPRSGPAREQVCITGNVPDIEQSYAGQAGQTGGPRNEAYQIEVLIGVFRPGDTQQVSIERAFEILAALELNVHRPNLTLSIRPGEMGPVQYSRINPNRVDTLVSDEGYECEIRCLVDCFARI